MLKNLGPIHRIAAIVLGLGVLGLFGAVPAPWRYFTLIGLVPLGAGLLGRCPVYRALGFGRTRG
jgi:hypothetical protein